jgi:hypothetical protein
MLQQRPGCGRQLDGGRGAEEAGAGRVVARRRDGGQRRQVVALRALAAHGAGLDQAELVEEQLGDVVVRVNQPRRRQRAQVEGVGVASVVRGVLDALAQQEVALEVPDGRARAERVEVGDRREEAGAGVVHRLAVLQVRPAPRWHPPAGVAAVDVAAFGHERVGGAPAEDVGEQLRRVRQLIALERQRAEVQLLQRQRRGHARVVVHRLLAAQQPPVHAPRRRNRPLVVKRDLDAVREHLEVGRNEVLDAVQRPAPRQTGDLVAAGAGEPAQPMMGGADGIGGEIALHVDDGRPGLHGADLGGQ